MQPGAAEIITARNVDLTSCDRELIQFPDAIQPHGVMLTLDEASHCILHASANCAEALGAGPEQILGKSAAHVLGRDGHDLLGPLHRMTLDSGPAHLARESFVGSDRGYHLFAHRSGGLVILELEIAKSAAPDAPAKLYSDLRADIARLQATPNLAAFFDLAVQRIRDFTGYDRVMAYRFDEDGSGEVVAESRREGLEAYLGLHYPASDIPLPARRLFALSWLRHLPDVDYVPVPLVAAGQAAFAEPVDMSYASLRSVSVMYTDYLKNMGVRSTMVMPLMKEGRLWGLVSAMHHQGPRHIAHETRMAAEFLAHTLSLLMSAKEDTDLFERVLATRAATDRLTQSLTLAPDFDAALIAPEMLKALLGLIEAGGVAVVAGDRIALAGKTPAEPQVRELAHWLGAHEGPLFATDRLATLFPPAETLAAVASGALTIRCGPRRIVWFRPEQIANVAWAGDPHKPVDVVESAGTVRLRPRGSFALWKESVRHRSTRWRDDESDAALRLQQGLDKALERARSKPEPSLEAFRTETDVFAQGLSQELKEQARGIYHLTTLLRRRQSEALDAEGRQQIATILRMTQRVDGLADALLRHARIGPGALDVREVDLDAVVDEALRDLAALAPAIEVRRPSRLGVASCNRAWIAEVFAALIDNAMRYNDKPSKWIEIGALPGPPTRYYVRDNGLGVAAADAERVFAMFHRLHEHSDYGGGAGIGLAFARKIVERHGGRMWLDSTPGEGSTFWFTLAAG
jgi:light-regulated signal transduction histidine kinase (bacteriophytochrome)